MTNKHLVQHYFITFTHKFSVKHTEHLKQSKLKNIAAKIGAKNTWKDFRMGKIPLTYL